MDVTTLAISGAFVATPQVHGDDRGGFWEWFREDRFTQQTGHPFRLAQANCSVSAAGTIRGVHFAEVPPGQAKYVTCLSGAALDVIVDLRVGSPTFGHHETVLLDDVDRRAVYIGEGLGHGFMALQDRTIISYACSAPYSPAREHGVHPLDPALGIAWPSTGRDGSALTPLLSPKDEVAPSLAEVEAAGLLPTLEQSERFVAALRDQA